MISSRIIGIDPGARATGWGIVQLEGRSIALVACGVIRLDTGSGLAERLTDLGARIERILDAHGPDEAAIEDVFVHRDPRAALKLGQARGAVIAAIARRGTRIAAYAPARVKCAVTGTGRAGKSQVARMVQASLGLVEPPPSDAADALAVAICHARSL